jgi:hypothetical protein
MNIAKANKKRTSLLIKNVHQTNSSGFNEAVELDGVQDVAGVELSAEHVLAEKLLNAFRSDSSTIVDLEKLQFTSSQSIESDLLTLSYIIATFSKGCKTVFFCRVTS